VQGSRVQPKSKQVIIRIIIIIIIIMRRIIRIIIIIIIITENFDKRDKKTTQITFPLRHFSPLKVVK
jgi:hypothetical protein